MGALVPSLPAETLLTRPFAYIVAFTLQGPIEAYQDFFVELQSGENWFNYIPGIWIVVSRRSMVYLTASLRAKIRVGDWLMVMPAKGPVDGWLPPQAWAWLNQNLPREW